MLKFTINYGISTATYEWGVGLNYKSSAISLEVRPDSTTSPLTSLLIVGGHYFDPANNMQYSLLCRLETSNSVGVIWAYKNGRQTPS